MPLCSHILACRSVSQVVCDAFALRLNRRGEETRVPSLLTGAYEFLTTEELTALARAIQSSEWDEDDLL